MTMTTQETKRKFKKGERVTYVGGSALSSLGRKAGKKLVVVAVFKNRGRPYLMLREPNEKNGKSVVLSPTRVKKAQRKAAKAATESVAQTG